MFYFLPIKDWYFICNTSLGVDLDTFMPLSKVGPEANKRIIFAICIRAFGMYSMDHKTLWSIFMRKCSTYQELEQKFGKYILSYIHTHMYLNV